MVADLFILAAGQSVRIGRSKPLVKLGSMTLLERAVRAGMGSGVRNVTVVTGADGREVSAEAERLGAGVVANPDYRQGLSFSVRTAAESAKKAAPPPDAVILAACDQPFLTSGVLDSLVRAARSGSSEDPLPAAAGYEGILGVPALFPRKFWGELEGLTGDQGAGRMLNRLGSAVQALDWPEGAVNLNRVADLARPDLASLPRPDCRIMVPFHRSSA